MQKTRSWQESFDRLEAARREERRSLAAEARQIRDAEAVYARAAALEAKHLASPILMLVSATPSPEELVAKPKRRSKPAAKPAKARTAPRKRAATPRTAAKVKPKSTKPRAARQRKADKPEVAALPAAIALPANPAAAPNELLLITPLPRSAALTPYRKVGLFGLIGSWLRIAKRQAASGLAGGLKAKPRTPNDEMAELRAENERLRRQIEALLSSPENRAKANSCLSGKNE